jgi:hypothetical protein
MTDTPPEPDTTDEHPASDGPATDADANLDLSDEENPPT